MNKSLNAWLKKLVYEANARGYKGNVVDDYGINHWVNKFRNNLTPCHALDYEGIYASAKTE